VYPEYLTDLKIMFCPSAADFAYGHSSPDELIDCTLDASGYPRGTWCAGTRAPDEEDPLMRNPGDPGFGGIDMELAVPGGGYFYNGWAAAESIDTWVSWAAWRENYGGWGANFFPVRDQDWNMGDVSESEFLAMTEWRRESTLAVDPSFTFTTVPVGNGGTPYGTIYRLREGIERFMITDINNPAGSAMAQSDLAIMWDWVAPNRYELNLFNHIPGGVNILFMDGHVEFVRYPHASQHPVTVASTFEYL